MSAQRFTPEFKEEAVKQVTEKGLSVTEVAVRLGILCTNPDAMCLSGREGETIHA